MARALWVEQRKSGLLDCQYFHVVFTVPEPVAALAYQNKALLYNLLFSTTAETLRTIAADPKHLGAEIGFLAVLHTWGQTLTHHPHVHCLVPGGGLSSDGQHWIGCRPGFFLHVRVLSRLFRRRFLEQLDHLFKAGQLQFFSALEPLREPKAFQRFLATLRKQEWVVYAKPPFADAATVLDYLGRYTHRMAISSHRLVNIDDGNVTFRWRDYRDGNKNKVMTLAADEFLRRFLLHVLPPGFQRLRYYGFLANRYRKEKLARCRELLGMRSDSDALPAPSSQDYRDRYEAITGVSLRECPVCHIGRMLTVEHIEPCNRSPPLDTS
jgi:hypothetical protein